MVITNKTTLIEKLTGIHSSKKSYYVELKKKISELEKKNIQLEIINQLTKSIGVNMSLHEIIENFIPKMQTLVYFDLLNLYIMRNGSKIRRVTFYQDDRQENKIKESILDAKQVMQNPEYNQATEDVRRVLQEQEPYLVNSVEVHALPEDAEIVKHPLMSKVIFPLLVKDKTIGILELISQREFDEDCLSFISQVADQLAVCLENMELYNEVWQHKHEWEITFSAVTDLLVFINEDLEIQKVNQAAKDFFTLKEEEIIGQKCYKMFYGRSSKCNPCLGEQVLQTKKTAYTQARTRFNRILDIYVYPSYTEEDQPYGITYYAKDVTRIVDSIKFASLGEMSAGVAHELNSPLTAIVGNSQLLLRETSEDNPHYQLVKDIHYCGVRCQGIIRNLLTFSRQDELSFEWLYLDQVFDKAYSLLAYQIEKSGIKVIKDISAPLPAILGNAQGLEQIIVNLLLNAKDAIEGKYGREGKVQTHGVIEVRTRVQPDKYVALDITDNGCGIDPALIPHIFNPFYTSKSVGKGTGLGLSVSLGIAQSHKGLIDVQSTPGKGSTFSLILPIAKTD
ncbi:MAG: ATP-binding protein [Dethiobacteraceae bacterium]|jgi:two-component system NtrC family sensor kinase|nr:GAF domain-containing protein [Bacillota bacterium]